MKYIRTKDGRIHKLHAYQSFENLFVCENQKALPYDLGGDLFYRVRKNNVVKQADTIEELCDEFVVFVKGSCGGHWLPPIKDFEHTKKEYCYDEIYGAIWTDKGLIYVAKMNEKGELELL